MADFDVNDLDSGINESNLINRISQLGRRHYCEFDVRIVQTRTNPSPTVTRWQVVGIGTDSKPVGGGVLFGQAQAVDICDADAQDFGRVWADSFDLAYGGSGGALNGANSTLERWANAIAGTVSHEAGHNYGLQHSDSAPKTGEDGQNNHLLATGSTGLTGGQRTQFRHFSDSSFEILAAKLGLYEKTLTNWCFVNPNSSNADGFNIIVLVLPADGTPSKTSMYTGNLSPWSDVSISADTTPTETFQGTLYNRFKIKFITPKAWVGPTAGQVDAGEDFHVGVGIDKNNIVRDTEFTSGTSALTLKPRFPGYDVSSTFDTATGALNISLFNFTFKENGPLILSPARVRRLPRTLPIDQMVGDGELVDAEGIPILPWEDEIRGETITLNERAELTVGFLSEGRIVEIFLPREGICSISGTECSTNDDCPDIGDVCESLCTPGVVGPGDAEGVDIEYCPEGTQVSLFPSARLYIEITVTDPDATFYNPDTQQMEQGPLDTLLFFQVPGQMPDCNRNGVDDGIEILNGTAQDINNNGVPDECEVIIPTVSEWGLIILMLLALAVGTILFGRRRRAAAA
ncbi:MAG: IPTL-CTERM sorting domain-containing protein [Planctomycetes bacterium]|nr:IPTL-CTERM sorting domain-containing protein [Planctomycetota bacterium]